MRARSALAVLAGAALLVSAAPAQAARTKTIHIGDNYFAPATVKVKKGTTVKWNWTGSDQHNVVVQKGPASFQSSLKTKGSYKKKLKKKGTYTIICSIHAPDMRMKIKVK